MDFEQTVDQALWEILGKEPTRATPYPGKRAAILAAHHKDLEQAEQKAVHRFIGEMQHVSHRTGQMQFTVGELKGVAYLTQSKSNDKEES